MKYFGNILVGDGMRLCEIKRGYCRHRLNKELREIALGNRQPGQSASWWVKDLAGHTVFEGSYYPGVGIRYTVFNYQSRV